MPSEYEKAHAKYRELAKAATGGDAQAHKDKAKAMQEIRAIEREAARAGTVLNAKYQGDKLVVKTEQADSRRSLQEEYVRKFDDKKKVMLPVDPREPEGERRAQTLREFHRRRLLSK